MRQGTFVNMSFEPQLINPLMPGGNKRVTHT